MLKIKYDASAALSGLEADKRKIRNSLFRSLVISTALVRAVVIDNIRNGQRKDLGWPPFKASTISSKSKRGRSMKGLVDTGRMMTSIHESVSRTKLEGLVFPGVDYLKHHEFGTKKMAKRQIFAPVPDKVNRRITDIFKIEIAKGLAV